MFVVCDRTSLMTAADSGHVAVCDYLIRQGARLDVLDAEGRSYRRSSYRPPLILHRQSRCCRKLYVVYVVKLQHLFFLFFLKNISVLIFYEETSIGT